MIIEHACVTVTPGGGAGFEAAVATAASDVLPKAQGWLGLELIKCIEHPDEYIVEIRWETVEAHMVTFRESALFQEWRALVGPFFASPPNVRHYAPV
ncbi:MAG: antibiotic biosynthesis monooxygenase family protein [Maritimibacter sp.]